MEAIIFILLFALISPNLAKTFGSINIDGTGQIYIVGQDFNTGFVQVQDNKLKLEGGTRIYFSKESNDGFNPGMFWQTNLVEKHFSYHIDVSNVGCHCNAAAYFLKMGGNNQNGGTDGDYYCDANYGNNVWCPEYDSFEGNKFTMAVTLHTCEGGKDGYWSSCDRQGCSSNAHREDTGLMCPEDRCTINTNRPFTVSHFQSSVGQINVWFEQEGRTASFDVCGDQGYRDRMGQYFGGMVFSASLWGGVGINMDWLDGMTGCHVHGDCHIGKSSVTFEGFSLW